jgi:protein pelota
MAAVEKLREALSKDMATYGKSEVGNAISVGAAESMLILSEKTRSKEVRKLLNLANKNRTTIIEISSHHHGGEMLTGLGDVAVVLRYRLT